MEPVDLEVLKRTPFIEKNVTLRCDKNLVYVKVPNPDYDADAALDFYFEEHNKRVNFE